MTYWSNTTLFVLVTCVHNFCLRNVVRGHLMMSCSALPDARNTALNSQWHRNASSGNLTPDIIEYIHCMLRICWQYRH